MGLKYETKKKIIKFLHNKNLGIFMPRFFYFAHKGYCPCCDKKVVFAVLNFNPWLRDYFRCTNCFSIPRERALMVIIDKYYPDWRNLSIHESSPGHKGTSAKLKKYCAAYVPSQYYPNQPLGTIIDSNKNEDLENLTFSDESFDLVITQDVMEHVYEPEKAFQEIARTLKKGGAHIFTTPLINKHKPTEKWAVKGTDGKPVFLHTPEYHGNPVNDEGSPVTMHWGFDIVEHIKEATGMKSVIEYIDDLNMGIRAEYIEVVVSVKS